MYKECPIVRITWFDAQAMTELPRGSASALDYHPIRTESVGFVVDEHDDCWIIAQSSYHANKHFDGHIRDLIIIPKGMIVAVTKLGWVVNVCVDSVGGCDCGNC